MRHLAAILSLLLAACSTVPAGVATVTAAQVRVALDRRHGWTPETRDSEYLPTTLDALWRANVDSWRHETGETWDCEDNADAMLVELKAQAAKRGDAKAPAAFAMPVLIRDGRRHMIVVAACITSYGAAWRYWDASARQEIPRTEIIKPL